MLPLGTINWAGSTLRLLNTVQMFRNQMVFQPFFARLCHKCISLYSILVISMYCTVVNRGVLLLLLYPSKAPYLTKIVFLFLLWFRFLGVFIMYISQDGDGRHFFVSQIMSSRLTSYCNDTDFKTTFKSHPVR